jgi:hypothetical protein
MEKLEATGNKSVTRKEQEGQEQSQRLLRLRVTLHPGLELDLELKPQRRKRNPYTTTR